MSTIPTAVVEKADAAMKMLQANSPNNDVNNSDSQAQETASQSEPAPTESSDPAPMGLTSTKIDPEDWKSRYSRLRNSREEKMGELESQVSNLTSQVESLEAENAELKRQLVDKSIPNLGDFLSDEDLEDMDEDLLKKLQGYQKANAEKLQSLEDQSYSPQQPEPEPEFDLEYELDNQAKGWREINASPGWQRWLSEIGDTGEVRNDTLQRYANDGDVRAIIGMFNAYLAFENAHAQTKSQSDASVGNRTDIQYQNDTSGQGQIVSAAEFKAFQKEEMAFERNGRTWSDQRKRQHLDMRNFYQRALQEGRVR